MVAATAGASNASAICMVHTPFRFLINPFYTIVFPVGSPPGGCFFVFYAKIFQVLRYALFPEGRSDLFLLLPIKNRRAASPSARRFSEQERIYRRYLYLTIPHFSAEAPWGDVFYKKPSGLCRRAFLWALTGSPQRALRQCSRRSQRGPGTGRGRRRGNRSRRRTGRPDCLRRRDPERGCRPHGPPWSWHR